MEVWSDPMNLHQTTSLQLTDNIDVHHYDRGLKWMNVTKFEDFFPVIYLLHLVTARCSHDYPMQ